MPNTADYEAIIIVLAVGLAATSTLVGYFAIRAIVQPAAPNHSSRVLASGTLTVPFNSISYLPFVIDTAPTSLNITFSISNYNSYYPQSVALYLLTPTQYNSFQNGDHTSSSWSYPYSASLNTRVGISNTGTWYFAFQEQDPNGGFSASVDYVLQVQT